VLLNREPDRTASLSLLRYSFLFPTPQNDTHGLIVDFCFALIRFNELRVRPCLHFNGQWLCYVDISLLNWLTGDLLTLTTKLKDMHY